MGISGRCGAKKGIRKKSERKSGTHRQTPRTRKHRGCPTSGGFSFLLPGGGVLFSSHRTPLCERRLVDKVDRLVRVHDAKDEEEHSPSESHYHGGGRGGSCQHASLSVSVRGNGSDVTRTVLDRDVLRDPPPTEDGAACADRVTEGSTHRDDPDVLHVRAKEKGRKE